MLKNLVFISPLENEFTDRFLVLLLLIANAVQNAMVGPDTSLVGGILAAGLLLVLNTGVARITIR